MRQQPERALISHPNINWRVLNAAFSTTNGYFISLAYKYT